MRQMDTLPAPAEQADFDDQGSPVKAPPDIAPRRIRGHIKNPERERLIANAIAIELAARWPRWGRR